MPPEAAPLDPVRRNHSSLSSVRNAARLLKEFTRGSREIGVTDLSRRLGCRDAAPEGPTTGGST